LGWVQRRIHGARTRIRPTPSSSAHVVGLDIQARETKGIAADPSVLRTDRVRSIIQLSRKTHSAITSLTAQVAVATLMQRGELGLLGVALKHALTVPEINDGNTLGDFFMCALERPDIGFRLEVNSITFRNVVFPELEVTGDAANQRQISFEDCVIDNLELSLDDALLQNVSFIRTEVGQLTCSRKAEACLEAIGIATSVQRIVTFDATNEDILSLNITKHSKALKIILRSLFRQHGSGRSKKTFFRGIEGLKHDSIERCLSSILKHRLAYVVGDPNSLSSVWYANKAHSKRANLLIDTSATSGDIVLEDLLRA